MVFCHSKDYCSCCIDSCATQRLTLLLLLLLLLLLWSELLLATPVFHNHNKFIRSAKKPQRS
jgi:hypothetical protein